MPVPLYQAKADLFRALGHPVRIRVLELLSERDHAVYELLAEIPIEIAVRQGGDDGAPIATQENGGAAAEAFRAAAKALL